MGRYVLVDGDGVAVNTIIWDGVTELTVSDGFMLIPESDYKPSDVTNGEVLTVFHDGDELPVASENDADGK